MNCSSKSEAADRSHSDRSKTDLGFDQLASNQKTIWVPSLFEEGVEWMEVERGCVDVVVIYTLTTRDNIFL